MLLTCALKFKRNERIYSCEQHLFPYKIERGAFQLGQIICGILRVAELKSKFAPGFYQKLLIHEALSLHETDISKDINRTYTENPAFKHEAGHAKLRLYVNR